MNIELQAIGFSPSHSQSETYLLILSEVMGDRKIPVVLEYSDALQIAISLGDIGNAKKTSFSKIFKSTLDFLNGKLREIYIKSINEGIFETYIVITGDNGETKIRTTIGEALSLQAYTKCPILASEEVMNAVGIKISDDGQISDDDEDYNKRDRSGFISLESLEKNLQAAIESEDYIKAAMIRDEIDKIK